MKTWLCGITSAGNGQNLREMIEPVLEYFDGLVWTFHNPISILRRPDNITPIFDEGYQFLDKNKKEGKIILAEWCDRFFNSMNQFLWQGPMQDGDVFMVLDSMERVSTDFCKEDLPSMIKILNFALDEQTKQPIGVIQNRGKGFLYKYNEMLEFRGSPHTYPTNVGGIVVDVTLPETDFWNVRAEQRDKMSFVKHYLKYYLYPAGSNHCLLGLDKNGDPKELFPIREERRLKFRQYLVNNSVALDAQMVIDHIACKENRFSDDYSEEMKDFIESEKILNDVYRYYVLGDSNFVDDHDFKNMVKVE